MRLRYLHLPQCGPLTDAAVVFGREDLLAKTLSISRKGSLNFVVGVNGTGKSSLLRALYSIFQSLRRREWPALPVTLAWDSTVGETTTTSLLHHTNEKDAPSFFGTFNQISVTARRHEWEQIIAAISKEHESQLVSGARILSGPYAVEDSLVYSRLPMIFGHR